MPKKYSSKQRAVFLERRLLKKLRELTKGISGNENRMDGGSTEFPVGDREAVKKFGENYSYPDLTQAVNSLIRKGKVAIVFSDFSKTAHLRRGKGKSVRITRE